MRDESMSVKNRDLSGGENIINKDNEITEEDDDENFFDDDHNGDDNSGVSSNGAARGEDEDYDIKNDTGQYDFTTTAEQRYPQ